MMLSCQLWLSLGTDNLNLKYEASIDQARPFKAFKLVASVTSVCLQFLGLLISKRPLEGPTDADKCCYSCVAIQS